MVKTTDMVTVTNGLGKSFSRDYCSKALRASYKKIYNVGISYIYFRSFIINIIHFKRFQCTFTHFCLAFSFQHLNKSTEKMTLLVCLLLFIEFKKCQNEASSTGPELYSIDFLDKGVQWKYPNNSDYF